MPGKTGKIDCNNLSVCGAPQWSKSLEGGPGINKYLPKCFVVKMTKYQNFLDTIIDNMKLNSTNVFCDLIFSGSITFTSYMIWDLLIGITW